MPRALAETAALLLLAATLAFAVARPRAACRRRWRRSQPRCLRISALSDQTAAELLADAQARLGRQARQQASRGRVERVVVEAAEGADLLVAARDGDRSHLGPASLGPATRFVVDHAPCPVLLLWPDQAPGVESIPPPPPHPPRPGPPHPRLRLGAD